ncbi:ROK family protein [Sphingomonas sp.]|uniref:ROK family protein n=1 Tax=Sphingomonas sp. TaxID=28214 RepID=UPI0025EB7C05|nr:ROK family protein [Sphingomonas sp.]
MTATRLAGVELGGTKSIAVLTDGTTIGERFVVPTTTPQETLARLKAQLLAWHSHAPLSAIGIASFGPLQLAPERPGFGSILATPKPHWSGAAVARALTDSVDCPWRIDTDVNGAALAEYRWGAGRDCDTLCYVTIGTGLGGGLLIGGRAVHGAMHPEIGHLRLRRAPGDDFAGACPFHGDCIEGLIAGPALAARFGADPATVPDDHPAWRHIAFDLAELTGAILLAVSAERILFGGSVALSRSFLLPEVRRLTVARLGAYLPFLTAETAAEIILSAALGPDAGPMGAVALALAALESA